MTTSDLWTKRLFYFTVFCTGAGVLIFEVAAVRLLAPYFGASLYVLSSVLSVILAALSLGYFFGGRLADRMPYAQPLYVIIAGAGVIMIFLLAVSQYALPASPFLFSPISGPLVLSLGLFFVPAFLLGVDSPYVIRLLSPSHTKDQGAIVGSVFFWSTIGSITGSILAGFYLIPIFGLTLTILGTSLFIITLAGLALITFSFLPHKQPQPPSIQLVMIFFGIWIVAILFTYQILTFSLTDPANTVHYSKDGLYSKLEVFDREINGTTYRFLKSDSNTSSAIIPFSEELAFTYTAPLMALDELNSPQTNSLVLGAGSFTIPKYLHHHYPEMTIDVVDVEPSLQKIAHTYFELPQTEQITYHVTDARVYLNSIETTYDIIFSDVMNAGLFIPPHLSTVEFFQLLKSRLHHDGVAYINFIGTLNQTEQNLTDSMLETIASVFPNYQVITSNSPDTNELQNLVFVVRHNNISLPILDTPIRLQFTDTKVPISTLTLTGYQTALGQSIFTDDRNPVERLLVGQLRQQ
ncbi:MAG: fused MFS/spermidine synthase [Candidatus Paceibacteria bacterium]